jgi:hypothetical protein
VLHTRQDNTINTEFDGMLATVLLAAAVISSCCTTQAKAAPCDQPGYLFMRHLWPAHAVYEKPFGTKFLQGTDAKPLLRDINAIRAACDADENCTIFTTNGRLLAMTPVMTRANRTAINFKWRKYYCGPCNDRDVHQINAVSPQPWQGSGCCGSSLQDARIPKSAAYFSSNQIDTSGKRCCGSYIAQEVPALLPGLLKSILVETPLHAAAKRLGMDLLDAETHSATPCPQMESYAATPSLCAWLKNFSAMQPASGCCPACVALLCSRAQVAQRQQGPALQKIVASLPNNNAGVGPCCKPVFTAHGGEAEFYCASMCGASAQTDAAFYQLYTQTVGGWDIRTGELLDDADVVAARASACPGTCNATTRGKLDSWSVACGSLAPGYSKVEREYMFVKSKGVQGGRRPIKMKSCKVDAIVC